MTCCSGNAGGVANKAALAIAMTAQMAQMSPECSPEVMIGRRLPRGLSVRDLGSKAAGEERL